MPIPKPTSGQDEKEYISACIREIIDEYDAPGQAYAVCKSTYDKENMTAEFAAYDWDTCIDDQMKQYGDEEIANKVCGAIKAGNFAMEEWRTLPTDDCMKKHQSAGYTLEYSKWSCSRPKENDGQQGGVVASMSEEFARTKFEYSPNHKETMPEFMGRCMSDALVKEKKPYRPSRAGFCYSQYQNKYIANIGKGWK
jgi:hypothetical protein